MSARSRAIPILLAVAFLVFVGVGVAHASACPWQTGPKVLQSVGFESASDTLDTYNDFGGLEPGPAAWGIISQSHQGGTKGLWCAGYHGTWATYPAGTRGLAVLDVGDTSGYAQSWIQYSYIEPSVESYAGGTNPFVVNWSDTPTDSSVGDDYTNTDLLPTTSWITEKLARGVYGNPPTTAGYFRFQFVSLPTGSTGQGATIDDIKVTGYKFTAVSDLTAVRLSSPLSSVQLSWTAATSPSGDTPRYRIWRYDIAAGTWLELASTTDTSATDTGADVTKAYTYEVQPWDLSTEDWGPAVESNGVPAVYWNVYRFRNLKNGYYLWTASEAEKNNIVANLSKQWKLEGVAYRINISTNTSPLWRFRNLKSGFYLYTADANEKNGIVANLSKYYKLEGVAYNVSRTTGSPVWRFQNKKDGTYLYSADPNEKANIVAKLSKYWKLEGVAYLIAP